MSEDERTPERCKWHETQWKDFTKELKVVQLGMQTIKELHKSREDKETTTGRMQR